MQLEVVWNKHKQIEAFTTQQLPGGVLPSEAEAAARKELDQAPQMALRERVEVFFQLHNEADWETFGTMLAHKIAQNDMGNGAVGLIDRAEMVEISFKLLVQLHMQEEEVVMFH